MPNTGVFYLPEVSGPMTGSPEHFTTITRIRATCNKCSHMLHGTEPPELECIPGGAILQCPNCGARQAISSARFNLFANLPSGKSGGLSD